MQAPVPIAPRRSFGELFDRQLAALLGEPHPIVPTERTLRTEHT